MFGRFGRRRVVISPGGFTKLGGRLGRGALLIIAVELTIFVGYAFADGPAILRDHVALTPARVWSEPWQLVTSLLLFVDARDVIGALLAVWIFGGPLERAWGSEGLIKFVLLTGFAANVGMALWGGESTIGGLGPAAVALVVAFGLVFADPYVHLYGLLPLRGKHFAWFALGTAALASLTGGAGVHTVGLAAGGVAGWLRVTGLWRPSRLWAKAAAWRARRKLRSLPGGKDPKHYWN